eukprot:TRINITY_DN364_c0_g1_i6.p1 TRINITY_DN364_c0_g1~~TRINITY_DN364_c0_g1_i6.p1  ORF type:complete len:432 (+),score=123.50 TRINITY_DN364_c0_g1_i6:60-1298(+)
MTEKVHGMKVLVLDQDTSGIVSMAVSHSTMLQQEVYLFERIDNPGRELMIHLKALCLLRPTPANVALLKQELHDPKYGEYHIFFTNVAIGIDELAQADEHEVVAQVQEFYADFYPVNPAFFTFNVSPMLSLTEPGIASEMERVIDGICSVLLAHRKKPFIRYLASSDMCTVVAQQVAERIKSSPELYDFTKTEIPPLLLLLDRREDPLSPLLLQWTYQAMVHELIGITRNKVDLSHAPGVHADTKEVVLSPDQDQFYADNMYLNFGDLGTVVQDLVNDFASKTKSTQKVQTLEDIKKFCETFPEFRKVSSNVTKHVTIMGEISRQVALRKLLDVSEREQELACNNDHATAYRRVVEMLQNPIFAKEDVLRQALLYILRYEKQNKLPEILQLLTLRENYSGAELGVRENKGWQ